MTFLTVISGEKNTGDDMMQLDFQGLNKSFHGQKVLDNISGKINRGEKIGFIGANGIGKTTLARILAGEETPDTGIIKYSPRPRKYFI